MTYKTKFKQLLDSMAINIGLRNPGSKNRHNWVVSGQRDAKHHDNNRRFQIDFLKSQGLSPEKLLLEIGCGTLRGGIPIIDFLAPGNYYGVDVRQVVLNEALRELEEFNLQEKKPNIFLLNTKEQLKVKFDIIWSFQVLLHMKQTKLEQALEFVSRHLDKNGVFFATVLLGDFQEEEWQGFPVISRTLEQYKTEAKKVGFNVTQIGTLGELGYSKYIPQENTSNTMMLKFYH